MTDRDERLLVDAEEAKTEVPPYDWPGDWLGEHTVKVPLVEIRNASGEWEPW